MRVVPTPTATASVATYTSVNAAEVEKGIIKKVFESDSQIIKDVFSKVWVDVLATAHIYNAIAGENSSAEESKTLLESVSAQTCKVQHIVASFIHFTS